ncbi:MAG: MATE family efflux transporter [Blautia massiliensis (ex Durand et al. 2017)]
MENPLARKFDLGALLRFAGPNVLMMVTLSLYVIVDGVFISRILGTTALSAANMVYPLICLEMASAIMVATGGSAIIARKLGEGRAEEARRDLSFLTAVVLLMGAAVAVGGNLFAGRIVALLGASPAQFALCVDYARMLFCFAPAFFLQTAFQTFFVTAGRPALGLAVTLAAGLANIALDYAFMGPMQMGIAGAALATGIGYCIPALAGVAFFALHRGGALYFVRPKADGGVLLHACANGSSEMVSNLANAVTTFLFNAMFLRYYGEDGVAAITIILYFQYIFTALYFGYSNGIAPVVSFKYGCGDQRQLKQIFRSSLLFIVGSAVAANLLIRLLARPAVQVFAAADSAVYRITMQGLPLYAVAFLLMGVGVFASALFTAFSDGKTSAFISFSRTFVFTAAAIVLLPLFFQERGLWMAVPLAECLGLATAVVCLIRKRKVYRYA